MNLDSLNRKVHGLPVWAWAAITVIFLYVIYKWYSNRSGSSGGTANVTPFPDRKQETQDRKQETQGVPVEVG